MARVWHPTTLQPEPRLFSGLAILLFMGACGDRPPVYELGGSTMGTTYSLLLADPIDRRGRRELQQAVGTTLTRLESAMSTYLEDSDVSRFNRSESTDWFIVDADVCAAVQGALEISGLSDGAFDITVGPLVDLWGFGPGENRSRPPTESEIGEALERVGHEQLDTDCKRPALRKAAAGISIDLSGYAKGYAVDRLADLLDRMELRNYLVEVGGELKASGRRGDGEPWRVAIEAPGEDGAGAKTVVWISGEAVATSGDYRNFFMHEGTRYSHTIDPGTGWPVAQDLAAVTVVHESAAIADGLATALLVLGRERGMALAEDRELAALFQVRAADYVEIPSPAFSLRERRPPGQPAVTETSS